MTTHEYLSQYRVLSNRITYHTERLRRLRLEADAVSSRWGESISSHTAEAPYIRILENIESARAELAAENDLLDRLQEQIEQTVELLPGENLRLVLLYRYLAGKSYAEIGNLLFSSKASVSRWLAQALDELPLPEDCISICS